jgi:phosphonate transport system substrate-binding protein
MEGRKMYKKSKIILWTTIGLVCTMLITPVDAETITFGVYTSDKPTAMYRKFKPILEYLEGRLGREGRNADIKIKIYPSYSGALDAIVNGEVDFARFGPASYVMAKERNKDVRLLAMEHKKNQKRFYGIFIVPKSSSITSLNEVKGKSFAFGDKNSTIGRYLSQAELVKAGIYAKDLKSYVYLDRHDKAALAVAAGNYDAGVVKENTYKKYSESKGLKKIARFPNVTKPWVARAGFDEKIFKALQQGLLELKDKKILKNLRQDGFLVADDDDYKFVRNGMQRAKEFGDNS